MNSAIFCYVLTLFWSVAHFITVKFGLLPNSDVSEIAIVMSYLFYIILYFKVFMLYRKGEIHSAFRGVFVPIMATLGSIFILSGGLQSKLFVFYAAFCIIVVLLSFVYYRHRHGKVDSMSMVKKIKEWANNNTKSQNVLGPSTKRAFQKIADGEKLEVAGQYGTTNGAAMKILPVGIAFDYRKPDILMKNVVAACLPTHNTNVAISGAMAIAAAVSCCIRGGSLNDMVTESKKAAKIGASQGYHVSEADIATRIELAIELVSAGKNWNETLDDVYNIIGTGLATEQAVPAALAMAYYAAGDPMLCAKYCANIGGDTDTIGAMACGICGAYSGISSFDPSSLQTILTVNHLNWAPVAKQLVHYI